MHYGDNYEKFNMEAAEAGFAGWTKSGTWYTFNYEYVVKNMIIANICLIVLILINILLGFESVNIVSAMAFTIAMNLQLTIWNISSALSKSNKEIKRTGDKGTAE